MGSCFVEDAVPAVFASEDLRGPVMVLVVGATGELGRRTCRNLLARGHSVRAMTRYPDYARELLGADVEIVAGDLRDAASLQAATAGCHSVIDCAVGRPTRRDRRNTPRSVDDAGTAALVAAAREAGVGRIVYVSSLGAAPDAPLESLRMKYRAEWHVLHSGMHFTILRPTAFAETWLAPVASAMREGRRAFVFADGHRRLSWISAEDVARLAVLALDDPDLEDRTLDVGGSNAITLDQAITDMERAAGISARRAYVPAAVLLAGSILTGVFDPSLSDWMREAWALATCIAPCDSAGLERMIPEWQPLTSDEVVTALVRSV